MVHKENQPEVFLEHRGVAIYHCYDEWQVIATYWYTTQPDDYNIDAPLTEQAQFDVRDLPLLGFDPEYREHHAVIIRHAIEAGLLTGQPAADRTAAPELVVVSIQHGLVSVVTRPAGVRLELVDHDCHEVFVWEGALGDGSTGG